MFVIYIGSILLFPEAYNQIWQNYIFTFSAVSVGLSTIVAALYPPFSEIINTRLSQNYDFEKLKRETVNAERYLKPTLSVFKSMIPRKETDLIHVGFQDTNAILLSGEAGIGKSGIAFEILNNRNMNSFLFDARRLRKINTLTELSIHLDLHEDIINVLSRIAHKHKCLVIIDQLDSVFEHSIGKLLVEFAIECKGISNVSVLVISRHCEIEKTLLGPLLQEGFFEIQCNLLSEISVRKTLLDFGMDQPTEIIIDLAKNILLLEIICSILIYEKPDKLSELSSVFSVWEKYLESFLQRESENNSAISENLLIELERLALRGLQQEGRTFPLTDPPTTIQKRLISNGLITIYKKSRSCFFRHESLQDHLYARHATERGLLPSQVKDEICSNYLRQIYPVMSDFYERDNPQLLEIFTKEVLSG